VSLNEHDELLRPREVATVFGVRVSTIARWAREGRLSAVFTPGGHRRYRRADLQALAGAETDERAEPHHLEC
jgi:excisionase family DNA binding protein